MQGALGLKWHQQGKITNLAAKFFRNLERTLDAKAPDSYNDTVNVSLMLPSQEEVSFQGSFWGVLSFLIFLSITYEFHRYRWST